MPQPRDIEATWIPADKNAYKMRIFDCRPFTQTATSTVGNAEVAKSFSAMRRSDGLERRGRLPAKSVPIACHLIYKSTKRFPDGVIFRAPEMEHKWDIDLFDDKLYLSRSWTVSLEMTGHLHRSSELLTVSEVNASVSTPNEYAMAVRNFDFLLKTYVLGHTFPHSLPSDLPASERMIATYSFSVFGRAATFATYEDTTKLSA